MTRSFAPAGGWRLHIVHHTGFDYDGEASASYNEARLTPLALPQQMVLAASVRTKPGTQRWGYADYFENHVVTFQLDEPHTTLEIIADSMVETSMAQGRLGLLTRPELALPPVADSLDEYLCATERTALTPGALEQIDFETRRLDPHEAAELIGERVRSLLVYEKGVTGVHTSADEALMEGRGVCQDFTHVALGMLRGIGIPARYVSGYLHPDAEAEPGESGSGESHAWLEYFAGEWNPMDPTSGAAVGPRHVVVARGRDYLDAAPLKGIYHGAPVSALGVRVAITRVR
jgi:transglutaminase-like putative cysteine protease